MKIWLRALAVGTLMILCRNQSHSQSFREDFNTNVIASGDWVSSGQSVSVDQPNSWLEISSNGAYNDFADKYCSLRLPIVVELRERLVSGGRNYTLPNFKLYWGPTENEALGITYLPNTSPTDSWGWYFGTAFTNIHTLGPTTENTWVTIRAIIRSDGGELFVKPDSNSSFTHILSQEWTVPNDLVRVHLVQNWDAVCDYDFVHVSPSNPWCDDFENYASGSFPGGEWGYTGNNAITVDNSTSKSGSNSLRTFGVLGSCWAGIAVHPLNIAFPVTVEVSIKAGTEDLYGCNPFRSYVSVFTGSDWTQGPQVECFVVLENGDFQARASSYTVLTNLALDQWYEIRVEFSRPDGSSLHAKYWIDGTFYAEFSRPWESWMSSLGYLHTGAIEGTAWFDNICVSSGPPPPTQVALDIKPGSCPNPINITSGPKMEEPEVVVTTDAAGKMAPAKSNNGKEVLPVAILGSLDLNVADIDVSSIRLIGVAPIRSSLEDVSSPVSVTGEACACTTDGPDGFVDLSLKFYKDDIVAALGTMSVGETRELKITGKLTDGSSFEGVDCIVAVGNPHASTSATDDASAERLFNYPNPFNPATTISFTLPVAGHVTIKVYNSIGQEVASLVEEDRPAGAHQVVWDANEFASGVYLYRLTTDGFTETKKMLLMK